MKKILFLIVLFSTTIMSAFDMNNMFNSSKTSISFNSYIGSYYLPKKIYKKLSYIDKHFLKLGVEYDLNKNLSSLFSVGLNEKFIEKEILLDEICINYQMKNFSVSYRYDDFQLGEDSHIFNSNVNSKYFQKGVLEDYKLSGIEASHKNNSLLTSLFIGSNNFNRGTARASSSFSLFQSNFNLDLLYSMNNQEYNEVSYSLIIQHKIDAKYFGSYNSMDYMIMPELKQGNKYKLFSEQRLSYYKFSFYANVLYEKFADITDSYNCESSHMLQHEFINTFTKIIFRYCTVSEFSDSYFVREYTSIIGYIFDNDFKLALNCSYFEPSVGDNYYNLGIQIDFKYETK
jgi:hypothetical protein